ncbi:MAG: hypothetical protein ABSA83_23450 [Verrucomicrobiota bacterium]|jgi:hypothetical protein
MSECLFRNWLGLSFVLFAALSGATGASTCPGWLPTVGPAPLRFSAALRPRATPVLPPIVGLAPTPLAPKAEKAPPTGVVLATPAQIPKAAPQVAPLVESGPPEVVVSPQMLLKYFSKPTNGVAPAEAPPEPTPPKATEEPPSRAIYETGP